MKKIGGILVLIAFSLLLGGFFWKQAKSQQIISEQKEEDSEERGILFSESQIKNLGITLREAGSGSLHIHLSTRGKIVLHPDKLVHVLPKVSGVTKEARKNVGDSVKQGEVIAVLESREVADLKASYLAAKEKEKLAFSLFDREEKLYQRKVSAEQDFIHAKSLFEEAKINVQLAIQKLRAFGLNDEEIEKLSLQSNLRLYEIRSPMDGIILNRHLTQGEFLESTNAVYEIANLSKVWVEIGIYPKDLSKVHEGQMVEISHPFENLSAQAKIIYISPIIAEETIISKALAEVDNLEKKWRPGTFVKVNISTEKVVSPVVIGKESIQNVEGSQVVFVKTPRGFVKRGVQTGKEDDQNIEILSGLDAGEQYADVNAFLFKAELSKSLAEDED